MKVKRAVLVFGATTIGLVAFLSEFSHCKIEDNEPIESDDGATSNEEASADGSVDSSLNVEGEESEGTTALSSFGSLLFSVKDFIKPLVEPTAAKAEFGRVYMETAIPIFKLIYPEQSQQIESVLRIGQQMDDEYVEVYEALKALREQILAEVDETKKQGLKNRMAELVNRMQTLYNERINFFTSVSGLDSSQINAAFQHPILKDVKSFVESIITVPFRKLT